MTGDHQLLVRVLKGTGAVSVVGSLPVVEDGRVVGIITETDLLRRICGTAPCSPDCAEVVVSFP